jgi:hypothetical protein
MLDRDFCDFLEYRISEALRELPHESTIGFWCDGILLPVTENSYSEQSVNNNRQVLLKAFIGKDGQSAYELILKFGNKALSRYARHLDIKECIPDVQELNWFYIDVSKRRIEIKLK